MAQKSKGDIANTAVRMFLQKVGQAYDRARGFEPFRAKDMEIVKEYFGGRCCYCGTSFGNGVQASQDHLIPINKTDVGLSAWGNIVPACGDCNSQKHGKKWESFIIERASRDVLKERKARLDAFIKEYRYSPPRGDLQATAEDLYAELGAVAESLIQTKFKRMEN